MRKEDEQLIAAYLAGEDVAEILLAACKRRPELLNHLAEHRSVDRLLATATQQEGDGLFAAELRQRLATTPDTEFADALRARLAPARPSLFRRITPWAAAAAIGLAALLPFRTAESPVAKLVRTTEVVWKTAPDGETLAAGRHVLQHGCSELALRNGVTLILEAPVDFELVSADLVRVHRGQLVARVPEQAIGFTVLTPSSEVVDLGTEFGIAVSETGASEVHVIDGEVKARPLASAAFEHLVKDQGMSFGVEQQIQHIRSNPGLFRRALPGRSADSPGYLHWSFEDAGDTLSCAGPGIAGQTYPGRARALGSGGGPTPTPGPFGMARAFNGVSAYVETDFPGIGGHHPRTVTFWAKVPRDFSVHHGYGMLSWGRMANGAAWQISPNPAANEGPLGRLRIGVMEAPVIGSTDLRDDQWHHIAVVMYGGEAADTSTHILLYVDGQLEHTSVKSVSAIQTDLDSPESHPVMFGRNLAFSPGRQAIRERFFKGCLDEIYVFDTALEAEDIRRLMKTNQWN